VTSLDEIRKQRAHQGLTNSKANVDQAQAELDEAYATLFAEIHDAYEVAGVSQAEIRATVQLSRQRVDQIMADERKRRAAEKRKAQREARKANA
jgi:hypothetical protein